MFQTQKPGRDEAYIPALWCMPHGSSHKKLKKTLQCLLIIGIEAAWTKSPMSNSSLPLRGSWLLCLVQRSAHRRGVCGEYPSATWKLAITSSFTLTVEDWQQRICKITAPRQRIKGCHSNHHHPVTLSNLCPMSPFCQRSKRTINLCFWIHWIFKYMQKYDYMMLL